MVQYSNAQPQLRNKSNQITNWILRNLQKQRRRISFPIFASPELAQERLRESEYEKVIYPEKAKETEEKEKKEFIMRRRHSTILQQSSIYELEFENIYDQIKK